MKIVISSVSDAELHRACIIEAAAYADNKLNPILFPGPFLPDSLQKRVDQLIQIRKDDPTVSYLQAIDQTSGCMIAFAKWHIYSTPEEASMPSRKLEFGPGTNPEACMDFFGSMVEKKKEIMGHRPHICVFNSLTAFETFYKSSDIATDLHMLHTDPKYQGHGAGGALMEWGIQKADELGLPIYLESSPQGHRFYQKHGFKDVKVLEMYLSKYGLIGTYMQPLMMRETHASQ